VKKILRLRCECGRNLADVEHRESNPTFTRDNLTVSRRSNVDGESYRPWHEANQGGVLGSPGRAAATPGLVEGEDFDWHDRTYVWRCRCGRKHERRHERISEAWQRLRTPAAQRPIVVAVLDVDL
jgi:hypothetical protein